VPGVGVRAGAGPGKEAEGGVARVRVRSRAELRHVKGSSREGWALRLSRAAESRHFCGLPDSAATYLEDSFAVRHASVRKLSRQADSSRLEFAPPGKPGSCGLPGRGAYGPTPACRACQKLIFADFAERPRAGTQVRHTEQCQLDAEAKDLPDWPSPHFRSTPGRHRVRLGCEGDRP
jgi:hypothetical protein